MFKSPFCLIVLGLIFIANVSNAQVNNIVIDKSEGSHDPNEQFINGISIREDIGGVDIQFSNFIFEHRYGPNEETLTGPDSITFTNYNSFPVTVICEYTIDIPNSKYAYRSSEDWTYSQETQTKTLVLPGATEDNYPTRTIEVLSSKGVFVNLHNFKSITRKIGQQLHEIEIEASYKNYIISHLG